MDNRSLLVETVITGRKMAFDCPISLYFYGPNEPEARDNLTQRMRADKLQPSTYKAAVQRQKLAAQTAKKGKKQGSTAVGVGNGQQHANSLSDFAAGSSQGFGLGPSMEDIIGVSERFNPRNADQFIEEFGTKEEDLVSLLPWL